MESALEASLVRISETRIHMLVGTTDEQVTLTSFEGETSDASSPHN